MFKSNDKTVVRKKAMVGGASPKLRTYLMKTTDCSGLWEEGQDLQKSVNPPEDWDETHEDWIAVRFVEFFNRAKLLYDVIEKQGACNPENCKDFKVNQFEYLWQDAKDPVYKTATAVPAPVYIALLFDWVDEQIEDDTVFPKTDDQQFPQDFVKKYATKMFTRLFRVFTHIYYSHFGDLETLSAVPHADTFLLQYYFFVTEFKLIKAKEMEPLQMKIDKLCESFSAHAKK